MHDKYVRRRRAVLAVLVAVSLILLTAYFGEAENSPLHSIQQGIVEVFTPIQKGASTVLSPVRDLAGWVSSTLHAKSENGQLEKLNAELNTKLAQNGTAKQDLTQLEGELKMTNSLDLKNDGPTYAGVIGYDPEVWYETIRIDKGAASGIKDGDPVIAYSSGTDKGLVGDVTDVGSGWAQVSGLSSPKFGVEARVLSTAPSSGNITGVGVGTLAPAVGNPTTLQLNYLPTTSSPGDQDEVVTSGYDLPHQTTNASLYPPGIPIGVITDFNFNQFENDQSVNVSPFVDLRNVSEVEVLTKVHG